jgi:hypothetical protein
MVELTVGHDVELNTEKPSEAKEAFDRMFHGDGDFDIFRSQPDARS